MFFTEQLAVGDCMATYGSDIGTHAVAELISFCLSHSSDMWVNNSRSQLTILNEEEGDADTEQPKREMLKRFGVRNKIKYEMV